MYIDTHCHLSIEDYDDIDYVINENRKALVDKIIISGCTRDTIEESIDISKKYLDVYVTIGFHPSEADIVSEDDYEYIKKSLLNDKIVGIGETTAQQIEESSKKKRKGFFGNQALTVSSKIQKILQDNTKQY